MRVLFVIPSLAGGGAEKLINDLLPRLVEKDIDCELLIFNKNKAKYLDSLKKSGITVHIVPQSISSHFSRINYIKKFITNREYDIVHANLFPAFYYCAVVKMFSGSFPKLIMTEHSTSNRRRKVRILKPIERLIYSQYDRIVCISEGTYQSLIDWLNPKGRFLSKFCIVNNGIPLDKYTEERPYDRGELCGFSKSDIILCMVGSFSPHKNHSLVLEIMKRLPEEYKLILVGEGRLKSIIEEKVQKDILLNTRVCFLGFRNDIARIIHTGDISIIPSLYEGFGLVAVEAMACGKPVIASNVIGLSGIVSNYGFLASPDDPDSFIRSIRSLENNETYERFVQLSLENAKRFNIDNTVKEYCTIYKSV